MTTHHVESGFFVYRDVLLIIRYRILKKQIENENTLSDVIRCSLQLRNVYLIIMCRYKLCEQNIGIVLRLDRIIEFQKRLENQKKKF